MFKKSTSAKRDVNINFHERLVRYFLQIIAIFSPKTVLHIYAVLWPFLETFSKSPTYDLKVPK